MSPAEEERDTQRIRLDSIGDKLVPHQPENLPTGLVPTVAEAKNEWFVGSIDQGTTSTRFIIFDGEGQLVTSHQIEFENKFPEPG